MIYRLQSFLATTCNFLCVLSCLWMIAFPSRAQAEQIRFLTHSVGDQTYVDDRGELRGRERQGRRAFNVELVREMMDAVGHPRTIEVMPLNRAILLVESEPAVALFNLNRTLEREDRMKWVGPLQSSVTYLFENVKSPTGITSLEDAKKVASICVLRGNVHNKYLEKQGFDNLYPANSYASCVQMLVQGRVSLTPLSNLSSLIQEDRGNELSTLKMTGVVMMKSEGYLAFSKTTADEVIRQWQHALDQIKASGRYDELIDLYLQAE